MLTPSIVKHYVGANLRLLTRHWYHQAILLRRIGMTPFQPTTQGTQKRLKHNTHNIGGSSNGKSVLENNRNHIDATAVDTGRQTAQTHQKAKGQVRRTLSLCKPGKEKPVAYWLIGSAGITAGVMAMGAYVRLNESGLSMLDWRLLGRHLPKDDNEWNQEFQRYKTTPEYQQVHYNIELNEYKRIYIKEWLHRMMGRLSGVVFVGGALFLALRGALAPGGYVLTIGVMTLGLSQAYVGKWMVDSGFKELETENKTPRVSPYRLSIHFTNALAIYSICLWNGLKLSTTQTPRNVNCNPLRRVRRLGKITLATLFMTMLYGTIVAGNDAGLAYNTWPKMLDSYIPDDYYQVNTLKHMLEKTGVVQFNHRCLGYLTATLAAITYWSSKSQQIQPAVRKMAMGVLHASVFQVLLGIVTVLKQVPLHVAMAHHLNAMALWSILLALLARLR